MALFPARPAAAQTLNKAREARNAAWRGNPPTLVRNFDEVRYGCGYGIVLKKQKRRLTEALRRIDWRTHSNLAAHNCRHIGMEHIHAALVAEGFVGEA